MPLNRHRGSTAVEVALVLTLLACGLLIGYARLGGGAQNALSQLTLENMGSSNAAIAESTAAQQGRTMGVDRLREIREEETPIAAIVLSLAAVAGYVGFVGVMAVRKRRSKPADDKPVVPAGKVSELPEALFAKRQDLLHLFENLISNSSSEPATVDLVMSNRLSLCQAQASVKELRSRMKEERLRHLLVCDRQEKLLGVVSDRDLAKQGETAADVMSKAPITVGTKTPLITAVTILINRRFSSLPVVEEGKPVGILTTTDILLAMQATVMLLQRK